MEHKKWLKEELRFRESLKKILNTSGVKDIEESFQIYRKVFFNESDSGADMDKRHIFSLHKVITGGKEPYTKAKYWDYLSLFLKDGSCRLKDLFYEPQSLVLTDDEFSTLYKLEESDGEWGVNVLHPSGVVTIPIIDNDNEPIFMDDLLDVDNWGLSCNTYDYWHNVYLLNKFAYEYGNKKAQEILENNYE